MFPLEVWLPCNKTVTRGSWVASLLWNVPVHDWRVPGPEWPGYTWAGHGWQHSAGTSPSAELAGVMASCGAVCPTDVVVWTSATHGTATQNNTKFVENYSIFKVNHSGSGCIVGMLLIFTKSIIQHKFYINIHIEIALKVLIFSQA